MAARTAALTHCWLIGRQPHEENQNQPGQNSGGAGMSDVSYFRYVRLHLVAAFEALGWKQTPALIDTPHGDYSMLMQWAGKGEPREPVVQ